MTNALVSYQFEENDVRVIPIGGEPWFVAADVARALGYGRAPDMVRHLDDDEKGVQIVHTPSAPQEMTVISESGMYNAVLKSRKPEAKRFRRWVTGVVLPSIRRTGSFTSRAGTELLPARYWGTRLVRMFFRYHEICAVGDETGRTFYCFHDLAEAMGVLDIRELFRMVPEEYRAKAVFGQKFPALAVIGEGLVEMLHASTDLGVSSDVRNGLIRWHTRVAQVRMAKENQMRSCARVRRVETLLPNHALSGPSPIS